MSRARVAIVVVNWNGWRDTLACLESIRHLTYPNYLTIVADNGSWDDSVERIKAWFRESVGEDHLLVEYDRATALRGGEDAKEEALEVASPVAGAVLIENGENLGPTGGANVAIEYALRRQHPADYVFLLDNDATVDKDCLTALVKLAREVDAGIVGGLVVDGATNQVVFTARGSVLRHFFAPIVRSELPPLENSAYWDSLWASGAAMLIRADTLRAVLASAGRYLHAGLFMTEWEVELGYVSRMAGFKSVVTKEAIIWHKKTRTFGGVRSPIRYYYATRNRIPLANKMLPPHWKVLFHLVNVPLCLARVLKSLLYRRPASARAILCGWADGYRGVAGKWKHHDREVRPPGGFLAARDTCQVGRDAKQYT